MSDLNSLDINLLENASNSLIPNPYQFLNETSEVFSKSSNSYPLSLNSGYEAKSVNQKSVASIPAQSTTTSADLLISNATIPSLGIAGSSISVNYTEFNQGGISASGHYVDFYLSTDNIFSSNDSLLGYNYLSSLAAGSSSSGSKQLSLSSSLTSGTYYLFVKADGINQITESNESNNLFSQAITINNSSTTPRPDLMISSTTIPTTAMAGSTFNINYVERNNGTSSAASHSVNFYLSTDSIFSSNDTLLGQNTVSSLGSNSSSSGSKQLSLSKSLVAGTYYLFIKADGADQIVESNESNNLFSQAISVTANTPLPTDLSITALSTLSGAMVGGSIHTSYEEINRGSNAAGTHVVNVYLSTDDLLSSNDLLLGSSSVNSLAAGASTGWMPMDLPLSSSLTPGSYYMIFKADGNNNIPETDENNNLMKQLINISPPLPDLQISSALSSYQISNNTLTLNYTETNKGILQAASHTTQFYASTDYILSSDDIFLGDNVSPVLNVGASYSDSKTFTLDSNLLPRAYYLIIKTDSLNEVTEINEGNNFGYAYFTIVKPDLKIESVTMPSGVLPGATFSISYTDKNSGNTAASAHTVKFYLSTDNTLSSEDLLLGDSFISSLASNSTYPNTKTFTLDSSLNLGNYYLLIQTDADEQVIEGNENNNIYAQMFAVTLPIDLSMKGVSRDLGAMVGGSIHINYEEINQGSDAAGTHAVNVYLSTDNLLSSNDLLLGSSPVNSLAAGASTGSIAMNLPLNSSLTPGNYYMIFKADGNNNIAETDENNNLMKQSIYISPSLPDLQISSVTTYNHQITNNILGVSYTETNKGILQAASHTTQFYISTDSSFSSDDILLGDSVVPNIDVGASYSDFKTFTVNNNLPHGSYYLLVKADGQNAVAEINELNNFGFSYFTIVRPDLKIDSAIIPNSVSPGNSFTINYVDKNQGNSYATGHVVKFYLSTDNTLSSGDLLLGDSFASSLNPSAVYTYTKTLTLDSSLTVGDYYLLIQTDANEEILEGNENNNVYARMFTVTSSTPTPAQPDLTIENVTTYPSGSVKGSLSLNYTIHNLGNSSADSYRVDFYLSTDNILSTEDTFLGSNPLKPIAANSFFTDYKQLFFQGNPLGSQFIIIKVDGLEEIAESDELNNLYSLPIFFSF